MKRWIVRAEFLYRKSPIDREDSITHVRFLVFAHTEDKALKTFKEQYDASKLSQITVEPAGNVIRLD